MLLLLADWLTGYVSAFQVFQYLTFRGILGVLTALAITLLLCHMYLETKTTELVDSLEVASLKFLNSVTERRAPLAEPSGVEASARAVERLLAGSRK